MRRTLAALPSRLHYISPSLAGTHNSAVAVHDFGQRTYSSELAIRGIDAVATPGGRNSGSGITATIFGCSGFLGRYVAQALGKIGSMQVFPYRADDVDVQHLRLVGDIWNGNMRLVGDFDARNDDHIKRAISKSNLVINLIGADQETWNYSFEDVHVDIPRRIAKAVNENGGVQRFIHVSALGASPNAPSRRLRTKAAGEEVVRSELGDIATIFKVAPMTGTEDRLFNNWARLAKSLPFMPLVNGGMTRLQPVWVRDVTSAILEGLKRWDSVGKTYHLAGPDVYTYRQLVQFMFDTIREPPLMVTVPGAIARLATRPADWLRAKTPFRPNPLFSGDHVAELASGFDYVLPKDPSLLTFADLDIRPHRVTDGLPIEFLRYYRTGGYDFGTVAAEAASSGGGGFGHPGTTPQAK